MNHLDGLISNFSSAIVWLGKAWETYCAVDNIQKYYKDDKITTNQKVAKISANAVFIVAQTAEMAAHSTNRPPLKLKWQQKSLQEWQGWQIKSHRKA